jgi:hypothetical protein
VLTIPQVSPEHLLSAGPGQGAGKDPAPAFSRAQGEPAPPWSERPKGPRTQSLGSTGLAATGAWPSEAGVTPVLVRVVRVGGQGPPDTGLTLDLLCSWAQSNRSLPPPGAAHEWRARVGRCGARAPEPGAGWAQQLSLGLASPGGIVGVASAPPSLCPSPHSLPLFPHPGSL